MANRLNYGAVMTAIFIITAIAGLAISNGITGNAAALQKTYVTIKTFPANATIQVDGIQIISHSMLARTPFTMQLTNGKHVIKISKKGYLDSIIKFTVTPKTKEVTAILARDYNVAVEKGGKGRIGIFTSPANASIFIDEKFRGYTPLHLTGFKVGYHKVEIEKQGYEKIDRSYYIGDYIFENTVSMRLQHPNR